MSLMLATDKYIITAEGLHIDLYNYSEHNYIEIADTSQLNEKNVIFDIAVSNNGKYLAVTAASSKQLIVYDLLEVEQLQTFLLPRSASRIRFTVDNTQILVADKSGDVLLYNIKTENSGIKLLGHLSLLLDVLQTNDSKYIISSDRDEKIRVSSYPNTYNIQMFCLGHKEFVNHIELLPHNDKYLTSSSGDGTIKIWDYLDGKLYHTIDTSVHVNDDQSKQDFINMMDEGGIEVLTLPIVHYTSSSINDQSSILAVTVHTCNFILIYSLCNIANNFSSEFKYKLELDRFPSNIKLFKDTLFIYHDEESNVNIYKLISNGEKMSVEVTGKIKMFEKRSAPLKCKEIQLDARDRKSVV